VPLRVGLVSANVNANTTLDVDLGLGLGPPNRQISVVERKKEWDMTISHFLITF